jgi:hypothetical protein
MNTITEDMIYIQDITTKQYQSLISQKQSFLEKKFKELNKNKINNKYLEPIYTKYSHYFKNLINIKQQQLDAFHNLLKYIHSMNSKENYDIFLYEKNISLKIEDIKEQIKQLKTLF